MQNKRGLLLVAADNQANSDFLVRCLERDGHAVAVAEDGLQALDMMKKNDLDLCLLDIRMPKMTDFR